MAQQFDQPRVTVQPTGAEPVFQTGVFDQQAAFLSGLSSQEFSQSMAAGAQASAYFDKALEVYGKEAELKAVNDAPATIKYDGQGNVIAPSTFYPPGISTRAYAERFRDTARALYNASAEDELKRHSTLMAEKFAGDPASYAAAMEQKRQAMQVNLDPTAAPWIDLRGRQIQAQGASVLAVQAQSDQNKVTTETADRQYAGIVDEATRLAGMQDLQGKSPDQINDLIINSSALGQRWKELEVLWKSSGRTQPFIDRQRNELAQNVLIKRDSEAYKSQVGQLYGPDGLPNRGAEAAMRDNIRQRAIEFGKQFPGRREQYEEAVNKGVDFAMAQAGRRADQIQVNDRRANLPIQRQMLADQAEAQRLGRANDQIGADAITQRLEQQGRDILNDSRTSDSNAMIRAQAAFSAGAVSRGALQQSYDTRLQGLVSTINSSEPGIGPEHKAAANAELRTIRDDPSLQSSLTAGQRGYIESGINTYARAEIAGNFAAANLKGSNGELAPPESRSVFQGMIDRGQIHNEAGAIMSPAQAAVVEKQWNDAWNAKQTESKLAASAYENNQRGRPNTPEQAAALEKRIAFHNVGEKPDYNPQNPAERAKYAEYLSETGITPASVKAGIAAMARSKDPAAMEGYVQTYNIAEAYETRQLDRLLGPAGPNQVGQRTDMIKARVAARLGESEASYLLNVKKWGADKAFAAGSQAAYSTSNSGSAGGPADQTQSKLDQGLDTFAGQLGDLSKGATGLNQLLAFKMPGTLSNDPTERAKQVAAEKLLAVTPNAPLQTTSMGQVARAAVPFTGTDERFTGGVTYSPEVRAYLKEAGTMRMATDGPAIKAHAGKSAEEYVAAEQVQKAIEAGIIEPVSTDGGKTVQIQLTSANTLLSRQLGRTTPLSAEAVSGFAADLIKQEAARTNTALPDFDPKNAMMTPVMDSNNQLSWLVSVADRNGIPLSQMQIRKDDPRISAGTMAAQQGFISTIYDMKPGMSQADAVAAAGAIGRFVATTEEALFKNGRIDDIMAGRYVDLEGHRVDAPAGGASGRPAIEAAQNIYQREFQANLQKLQAEIGPNGPNAKEVLERWGQQRTPGDPDTTGHSWIQALVRSLGAGDKSPVKPPTRIGTESR